VGLDTQAPPADVEDRITFVEADVRSADLGRVLAAAQIDTIVHNDIRQFAEPGHSAAQLHDINVIGTLQLLTACSAVPSLRGLVVRGSAAIYGSEPGAPAFFTEDLARTYPLRTRFQRDLGELEDLFATFARRNPQVTCTMLRLQPVVGEHLDTPVTRLLRARIVPTYMGYDARVQVLHEDDSIEALAAAALRPVPGAVNVAADGTVSLRRVLRRLGRIGVPIAAPLFGPIVGAAGGLGLPRLSPDVLRYLRYGRGVDVRRMHHDLGFHPQRSTMEAIEAVAR
jgi:UDP-glucose 4-epimerase